MPNLMKVNRTITPLMLVAALAALAAGVMQPRAETSATKSNRYATRNGARKAANRDRTASRVAESTAPPIVARKICRFIDGIDASLTPMEQAEIDAELNDVWGKVVLRKKAGGAGPWPATVPDILQAVSGAPETAGLQQFSYLVGEGAQISTTTVARDGNRDLRYVITWGPSITTPTVFLAAAPPGVAGGTPPPFLQLIAFDPKKNRYNYYQYVSNADVNGDSSDQVRTWCWAGDTSYARKQATVGRGCFGCHLNGGLNMKEREAPWNNWNSPQAIIAAEVVPEAVANDPLFQNLSGADKFQQAFEGAQFNLTKRFVADSIVRSDVRNAEELLRRLIVTTTAHLSSSQALSSDAAGAALPIAIPKELFIYDSAFRDVLGLQYTVPPLTLDRKIYSKFLNDHDFFLFNLASDNGAPTYRQKGATYFAVFVPVPAYEDTKAIQQLIQQRVITPKFAAAILMVDFPNPIFSTARTSLMNYAKQIMSAKLAPDPADLPTTFAALVKKAARSQPADHSKPVTDLTPEQQFLYYWSQDDWQQACISEINKYLSSVATRIKTEDGARGYLTLATSRCVQFSNFPLISNLHEFDLLFPCTSLGDIFVQMTADGTLAPQPPYNGAGASPCQKQGP